MADGRYYFEKIKPLYLNNGSTDHQEIWYGDDIAPMNCVNPYTTLTVLRSKTAKIFLKTKLASVTLCCKSCCFKSANIKILSANSKHRS